MDKYLSQITFMYFDQLDQVKSFFEEALNLERVFEPDWAVVYKVRDGAYLGAVDAGKGSIDSKVRGGSLISLTVDDVMPHYHRLKSSNLITGLSDIRVFDDIGVKSFFFKGPQGYDFEIQEFTSDDTNFSKSAVTDAVQTLLQMEKAFCEASAAEGSTGWARFFSDEGRMMTKSGKTIDGPEAIEKAMRPLFALKQIEFVWSPTGAEVSNDETMGYTYGTYDRAFVDDKGIRQRETGMYITVWKKQADGTWRIAIDGGN